MNETPSGKEPGDPSNRAFLIGLAIAVVLAVAGYGLVSYLMDMSRLQDCAVTGRKNC